MRSETTTHPAGSALRVVRPRVMVKTAYGLSDTYDSVVLGPGATVLFCYENDALVRTYSVSALLWWEPE